MADNLTTTTTVSTVPSGTVISTDDAGAAGHVQIVKLARSTDGSATPITADADGMLVNLGTNNDVTISDGGNVISVDDGAGSLTVDGTVAISGTVAVTDNSGTLSVDDGAGSLTVDNAALSVTGGGVEASALRVTIANDSTGVVSVDDNGSTLSVDDGGGNISIDDGGNTITVDGTVSVTGVSTLAEQQSQTTHLATIAGDTTDIETAVELLDDTVATLGTTTYTEATTKGLVIGAVRRDADTTLADTTNEIAPLQVDANGRLKVEAFSGETLPVSGTITANLAAGTNNIGDVDILSIAAGDNNIGNVDIASIAAGDNNIGNVDVVSSALPTGAATAANQSTANTALSAIQTATELLDDVVKAEDAAAQANDKGIPALVVRSDGGGTLVGADGDYTNMQVDSSGNLRVTDTVSNDHLSDISNDISVVAGPVMTDDEAFTPGDPIMVVGFTADETATDSVTEGDGGAARMTLDRKLIATPYPHTAGGLAIFRSLDLDETEEEVKSSAGQIYACWVTNTATATRWIKFYNATAANVTVGTTTPLITIGIPGNSTDDVAAHLATGGYGVPFSTAITVAATTGVADNDTGAPGANDVVINLFYL
jgi:hypothetical protein